MKELLEKLCEDGYFLDTVATAFGQRLAEEKIKGKDWFDDWSSEFTDAMNNEVKKAVKEQVDEYLKTIHKGELRELFIEECQRKLKDGNTNRANESR